MAEKQLTDQNSVVLEMRNISKRFGPTVALNHVSLSCHSGRVHALVGENGAGKSTLMKVLSGLFRPDNGNISILGNAYNPSNPLDARKSGIAMIYQELSLADHLTVEENIILGTEPNRMGIINKKKMRNIAQNAIMQFNHPELKPDILVGSLSIAAKQLVEIARALASGCKILVLDEPTSSLTNKDVQLLFGLIEKLKKQGIAIIYISHFLEEIRMIADDITILRDGENVHCCKARDISNEKIIHYMVGRDVEQLYPRSQRKKGELVLDVKNLMGVSKPRSASLQLHRGQVLGIAGLVGAGRTELFRAIFGLDKVKNGTIKVKKISGTISAKRSWETGVGYLSESRKEEGLALSMNIADNITITTLNKCGRLGLISPAKQIGFSNEWIDKLKIKTKSPLQKVNDLSGGNQQKVALARIMQHNADILLLDEPTKGIDVGAKAVIYELINTLACGYEGKEPKAVLIISSYLPELMGICDRVAVMCKGKLGRFYNIDEIDENRLMLEATGQFDRRD